MSEFDTYKELLSTIREEWDKSEEYIKQAEQVNNAVVFPSIKELRYAGRRIVEGLYLIVSDGDRSKIEDLLRDAKFDCHRARHDAIDAATAKIAVDLDIAVKYLGADVVIASFPEYQRLISALQEARNKIVRSRGDRGKREDIYSSIESDDFPILISLYDEFKRSESIMKEAAKKAKAKQTLANVIAVVGMALALFFAIIAFK